MKWSWASGTALMVLLMAARGEAGDPENKAAADALFAEGQALAEQGKFTEACPKFAESHKLDPTPGSALTLADCLEGLGQTYPAWRAFGEAKTFAQSVGDADRAAEAQRRLERLEPKLVKLLIEVSRENLANGIRVTLDGVPVPDTTFNQSMPVEPGIRTLEATAPGKITYRKTVTVPDDPGVVAKLAIPRLGSVDDSDGVAVNVPPVPSNGRRWQWPVGIVAMGVGAAGMITGSFLGANALDTYRQSNDGHCFSNNRCDQAGIDLRADAMRMGQYSTATLVVGGLLAAGGVVLLATAPPWKRRDGGAVVSSKFAGQLELTVGGVQWRGVF